MNAITLTASLRNKLYRRSTSFSNKYPLGFWSQGDQPPDVSLNAALENIQIWLLNRILSDIEYHQDKHGLSDPPMEGRGYQDATMQVENALTRIWQSLPVITEVRK